MAVLRAGEPETVEETVQEDGRTLYFQTLKVPMREDGVVTGLCNIAFDITERKAQQQALVEQKAGMQAILEHSPVGTAFTTDGVFGYTNPEFERMFGLYKGDPAARIYVSPEDRAALIARVNREGSFANQELKLRSASGEIREYLSTFLPFVHEGQEWTHGLAAGHHRPQTQRRGDPAQPGLHGSSTGKYQCGHLCEGYARRLQLCKCGLGTRHRVYTTASDWSHHPGAEPPRQRAGIPRCRYAGDRSRRVSDHRRIGR